MIFRTRNLGQGWSMKFAPPEPVISAPVSSPLYIEPEVEDTYQYTNPCAPNYGGDKPCKPVVKLPPPAPAPAAQPSAPTYVYRPDPAITARIEALQKTLEAKKAAQKAHQDKQAREAKYTRNTEKKKVTGGAYVTESEQVIGSQTGYGSYPGSTTVRVTSWLLLGFSTLVLLSLFKQPK